jgi:hypothetical protein
VGTIIWFLLLDQSLLCVLETRCTAPCTRMDMWNSLWLDGWTALFSARGCRPKWAQICVLFVHICICDQYLSLPSGSRNAPSVCTLVSGPKSSTQSNPCTCSSSYMLLFYLFFSFCFHLSHMSITANSNLTPMIQLIYIGIMHFYLQSIDKRH